MALVYIEKVTQNQAAFESKVVKIANALGMNPNWLMTVMYAESNLNHLAQNPGSSAFGLIQFLEATLKTLGTTRDKLKAMSNVAQLDYVEKYFKNINADYQSIYDVYFAVFYPSAIGLPDSHTLFISGGSAYVANRGLDTNQDYKITVGEVKAWFSRYIKTGTDTGSTSTAGNTLVYAGGAGLLLLLLLASNNQD